MIFVLCIYIYTTIYSKHALSCHEPTWVYFIANSPSKWRAGCKTTFVLVFSQVLQYLGFCGGLASSVLSDFWWYHPRCNPNVQTLQVPKMLPPYMPQLETSRGGMRKGACQLPDLVSHGKPYRLNRFVADWVDWDLRWCFLFDSSKSWPLDLLFWWCLMEKIPW